VTLLAGADLSRAWFLSERVSLREEYFGALAYHHDTRRLIFLKSPQLVDLVRRLADYDSALAAIDDIVATSARPRYERALRDLIDSGVLDGR
jgi:mycofactocin biosynthesis protein MftB